MVWGKKSMVNKERLVVREMTMTMRERTGDSQELDDDV